MISERTPMRNSTEVRRRCSSSMVLTSLKSGTTIDSCVPLRVLRDMTETPARRARQIVSDQLNALADEKRPGLHAAQQDDLFQPRFEETRGRVLQRLVYVAGMNHQFSDAWPSVAQHPAQ